MSSYSLVVEQTTAGRGSDIHQPFVENGATEQDHMFHCRMQFAIRRLQSIGPVTAQVLIPRLAKYTVAYNVKHMKTTTERVSRCEPAGVEMTYLSHLFLFTSIYTVVVKPAR